MKKWNKLFGENVSPQRVGGEVLLDALLRQLPLVDHASGVVDQDVQLLVFRAELVGKLKQKLLSKL